jgi:hypothetical protein
VSVPLTINISGFPGTGPLQLQYSLTSPPVWNVYLDAVATGTAIYHFPSSAFSVEGGTLYLRISREFVTSGMVSIHYGKNTAPTIQIVSPTTRLEILENPLNSSDPIDVSLNIADSDSDDILALRYRIDNGSISELTKVNRGPSITIEFPKEKLLKTPGLHTLFFQVSDGIDVSDFVTLEYLIVAAPILKVVNPATLSFGSISPENSVTVSLNVTGSSTIAIQYQLENSLNWVTIDHALSEDIVSVTLPAGFLNGAAASEGIHTVLFRSHDEIQASFPPHRCLLSNWQSFKLSSNNIPF